jgi:hypothetical protein
MDISGTGTFKVREGGLKKGELVAGMLPAEAGIEVENTKKMKEEMVRRGILIADCIISTITTAY